MTHGIGPDAAPRGKRVNWGAVAGVVAVASLVLSVASGAFGDYRKVADRVTVLETQRAEDVQRREQEREETRRRLERIEDLLQKLWERGR